MLTRHELSQIKKKNLKLAPSSDLRKIEFREVSKIQIKTKKRRNLLGQGGKTDQAWNSNGPTWKYFGAH